MTLFEIVRPRKLVSLPILSAVSPSSVMLKLPTGVGRPGSGWAASGFCSAVIICGADNDSVRLGISTVAGIADGVDDIRAVRVVQDRRAAIVATVGIGFCEAKPAVLVDRRDHAGKTAGHGIAGIDHRRRVGIRDIE